MSLITKFFTRLTPRQKALGALVFVVILMAVAWSAPGHALDTPAPAQDSAANQVQKVVFSDILSPIVNSMIRLFSFFTAYIVGLLVLVAQQNNFINSAPVVTGYPIVRDLSNMVFIVALLIIAAGTILRLENYRYNRLLGRLIIMAFLVNLARFITGFFIQTSQVFMLTFVNAFKDIALGNFAYMFGLDAVLTFSQNHTTGTDAALFITLVAGLAMMIIAFSVILALTVILVVRIIALWILTILSPLAYALRIIPNTDKYASRWWSEFGKYVVTGPVLAFFLWLALALTAASSCTASTCTSQDNILFSTKDSGQNASLQKITSDTESQIGALRQEFVTEIFDPNRLLTFIVSIIFLIMGMQYAAKSGTFGASFAKRVYEGGLGAGATLTGLNAIRDRTVAPIQGYLATRRARRDSGIKERSAALGAGVDATLSATVGQVGRGRAAVTGAAGAAMRGVGQVVRGRKTVQEALQGVAENAGLGLQQGTRARRQAQGRVAQYRESVIDREIKEKDLQNATPQVINDMVNSGGYYQRAAAGIVGLNRGAIDLNDGQRRDQVLRDMAVSMNNPDVRKRFQDAMEKGLKRAATTDNTLELVMDNLQADVTVRLDAAEVLAERGHLDVARAQTADQLANQVSPDKVASLRKTIYKRQEDIALAAFHNNLGNVNDAQDLVAAIDRGDAKQGIIQRARSLPMAAGVREELRNGLYEMHRAKGTLDKMREDLSDQTNEWLYQGLNMAGASYEERAKVATSTGLGHIATDGFTTAEFDDFTSRYADKFAENAAVSAMSDPAFMQRLADSAGFRKTHFDKMAKKNGAARTAVRTALRGVDAAFAGRSILGNTPQGRAYRKVKSSALSVSFGEDNLYNNILTDANHRDAFQEAVGNMEGGDLSSLQNSTLYTAAGPDQAARQEAIRRLAATGIKAEEIPKAVAAARAFWMQALEDADTAGTITPPGGVAFPGPELTASAKTAYRDDIRTAPYMP